MRKFLMKCKCTLLILCIIFGITAIVPDISEKSPFVVTTEAKKKKKKKAKYSAKYFRRMGGYSLEWMAMDLVFPKSSPG